MSLGFVLLSLVLLLAVASILAFPAYLWLVARARPELKMADVIPTYPLA
jgi:Tfp pilus assembly protein PilE